ncbi:MAG: DUF6804 family protein [Candidatus Margulisiibacteriota bacterium]
MNYLVPILAIIMLLVAVPVGMPYGYYILLRWFICGASAYNTYLSYEQQKRVFVWMFALLAILFNPIFPIYLDKELWVIIDFISVVIFFVSLFIIKPIAPNK